MLRARIWHALIYFINHTLARRDRMTYDHDSIAMSGDTNVQDMNRRRFFVAATSGAIAAALAPAAVLAAPPAPAWRSQNLPSRLRQGFSKDLSRLVDLNGTNQGMRYWDQTEYLTPHSDFYIRNEYPTPQPETDPRVARATWRLKIHGDGIERPIEIGYNDLLKMPSRTLVSTMECAGNGRSLFWEQQDMLKAPAEVTGTGWGLGGIGQAEWRFVTMEHILGIVGLKKTAKSCLFWSGVDGKTPGTNSDTGRPVPINALLFRGQHIGVAFQMNGQDLSADHGAPVRALVPGWCGAASTKWLTEIKIATHDFFVPLNTKRHVLFGPDYVARAPKPGPRDEFRFTKPSDIRGVPVTWSPPRSMLTIPLVIDKQPKFPHNYPLKQGELPRIAAGRQKLRGYAWAPQYGVKFVEARVNGAGWQKVRSIDPLGISYRWSRFEFDWDVPAGRHLIETRVTDMNGTQQPTSVPFNEGGFDFWAVPKFHIEAV
jgi:sulfane dehydrogenase subunit SoxC